MRLIMTPLTTQTADILRLIWTSKLIQISSNHALACSVVCHYPGSSPRTDNDLQVGSYKDNLRGSTREPSVLPSIRAHAGDVREDSECRTLTPGPSQIKPSLAQWRGARPCRIVPRSSAFNLKVSWRSASGSSSKCQNALVFWVYVLIPFNHIPEYILTS